MSRYASTFEPASLAGPGDSRPTAMDIIRDDNLLAPALSDKVIVMTGASAGIGVSTARALASTGARCFLGVRNLEKGRSACADFLAPGRVELYQIDTSSLASVRSAAAHIRSQTDRINVVVNNAGVMAVPTRELTDEGWEMQLATNYLGHFLLVGLLREPLTLSATTDFASRVVNVSSSGHHASGIRFDDLNWEEKDAYTPFGAYGQSKTAMIYMTNHIERLYGKRGLHGISLMPGGIFSNLQKHIPKETRDGWRENPQILKNMKNEDQGAATTVLAAVGREWEGRGGRYLEDCQEAPILVDPPATGSRGVAKHAYDEASEARLWQLTNELLGLPRMTGH